MLDTYAIVQLHAALKEAAAKQLPVTRHIHQTIDTLVAHIRQHGLHVATDSDGLSLRPTNAHLKALAFSTLCPPDPATLAQPVVAIAVDGGTTVEDRHTGMPIGIVITRAVYQGLRSLPAGLHQSIQRHATRIAIVTEYVARALLASQYGASLKMGVDLIETATYLLRLVMEFETGAACAHLAAQHGFVPIVCFDGSLPLVTRPQLPEMLVQRLRAAQQTLKHTQAILIGYIDMPQHTHLVTLARKSMGQDVDEQNELMRDVDLIRQICPQNRHYVHAMALMRKADDVFESSAIDVFYLNTAGPGEMPNIARAEIALNARDPQTWTAAALYVLRRQIELGHGYPMLLGLAHQAATLDAVSRRVAFYLARRHFATSVTPPMPSRKYIAKRMLQYGDMELTTT